MAFCSRLLILLTSTSQHENVCQNPSKNLFGEYFSRSYLREVTTQAREHMGSMHLCRGALVLFAPSLRATQAKTGFPGAPINSHISFG